MAKKSTAKRQQPSKPGPLRSSKRVTERRDTEDNARISSVDAPIIGDDTAEKQTRTAAEDNEKARDLRATHDPKAEHERQLQGGDRQRTKKEIEEGKKKGKYEVLTEGSFFDGHKGKCKMGETVTLTKDEADSHRAHGVALAGPRE